MDLPAPQQIVKSYQDRERWTRALLVSQVCTGAKLTGVGLQSFLNIKTGQCNPSARTLAEVTGQMVRNVERHLPLLKATGLLDWDSSKGSTSNRYRLLLPACAAGVVVVLRMPSNAQEGLRAARLTESEVASLGGAMFSEGPPALFSALTFQQEATLRRRHQELDEIWPGVRFERAQQRGQA